MQSRASRVGLLTLAAARLAVADIVPGTVSTDPFDSLQGTTVGPNDAIVDPINAFRTSGGFEGGHVLMRNDVPGSLSFIEFDTPCVVTISGVRLFAHNDGVANGYRRAMSGFTLLADVDDDGTYESTAVTTTINVDYATQPGNVATDPTSLDQTLMTSVPVSARHWRLEVIQGTNMQPFEGARLVELDALGPNCSAVTPKEVSPAGDMQVEKAVGTALYAYYTPACGAIDNTAYIGQSATALRGLTWSTAACAIGNTGVAVVDPGTVPSGSFAYFVLAGHNGVEEGSYGRSSRGAERPEADGLACDFAQTLVGSCP